MKIVVVHNRYAIPGRGSGEEVAFDAISNLLKEKGHTIVPHIRSSLEIEDIKFGKLRAFFSGIYSLSAKKEMERLLEIEKPDLVFVQNVYPLLSPSGLVACRKANVPVIMRCPNYRLVCPSGLFVSEGEICERCAGGRAYWCILKNCEDDIFKSIGYALRAFVARQFSLFKDNVDVFMVLTEFAKKKLVQNGFSSEGIQAASGLANPTQIKPPFNGNQGRYIGFVGRVSPEKGIDTLVEAAKRLPKIPFKVAGRYDRYLKPVRQAPDNVQFMGQLDEENLKAFYAHARMIVAPSRCYEGLPMAIIEAMLAVKPVITSSLGGLPEIVEDGSTGLLFRHDDVKDFTEKVKALWNNPELSTRFGLAGREKAEKLYGPDAFYERFMHAYESALSLRNHRQLSIKAHTVQPIT